MEIQSLRGTQDFYNERARKFEYLTRALSDVCKRFSFERIYTPVIENSLLFTRSVGESSDIVRKEMYIFEDKGGREIALSPEGTASVARAVIERGIEVPAKLFYIAPFFRYERPQKGRFRQFHQIGVEHIGGDHKYADLEVILLADALLQAIGIDSFSFQVNNLGAGESRQEYIKYLKDFIGQSVDSFCSDCKVRHEQNPLRVLDCKVDSCQKLLEHVKPVTDFLSSEEKEDFESKLAILKEHNINYVVSPGIVRGLDYYTGLVFEVEKDGTSILAGGRYDDLYGELGKKEYPAIGFAAGIERLMELIPNAKEDKLDIYVIFAEKEFKYGAFNLASRLRQIGFQATIDDGESRMKKQFAKADKLNARFVAIVSEEGLANENYNLKDMATGEQEVLNFDEIVERLKK